jgi:hypothetical protein
MRRWHRLAGLGLVALGILASPALAGVLDISVSGTGSAAVQSANRLVYDGTVTGLPFSNVKFFREPERLAGYLDLPVSGPDAGGCYSNVAGVLQLYVKRGHNDRLAFELDVTGIRCGTGSFTGVWQLDSSNSRDAFFRDATGSGTLVMNDTLDPASPGTGVFSIDLTGSISVRH